MQTHLRCGNVRYACLSEVALHIQPVGELFRPGRECTIFVEVKRNGCTTNLGLMVDALCGSRSSRLLPKLVGQLHPHSPSGILIVGQLRRLKEHLVVLAWNFPADSEEARFGERHISLVYHLNRFLNGTSSVFATFRTSFRLYTVKVCPITSTNVEPVDVTTFSAKSAVPISESADF